MSNLHLIGAHDCEVFIYWRRFTPGVSNKVWYNDKRIAKENTPIGAKLFTKVITERGGALVTHWIRIREDRGSIPDPAILISWRGFKTRGLYTSYRRGDFTLDAPVSAVLSFPLVLRLTRANLHADEILYQTRSSELRANNGPAMKQAANPVPHDLRKAGRDFRSAQFTVNRLYVHLPGLLAPRRLPTTLPFASPPPLPLDILSGRRIAFRKQDRAPPHHVNNTEFPQLERQLQASIIYSRTSSTYCCGGGRGGSAVGLLASHQVPPGFNPRPGHPRIFASGNRAGRCRWSVGFLRDLPFLPPLHYGTAPYSPQSPSSALKTPMLRAAQISSLTPSKELTLPRTTYTYLISTGKRDGGITARRLSELRVWTMARWASLLLSPVSSCPERKKTLSRARISDNIASDLCEHGSILCGFAPGFPQVGRAGQCQWSAGFLGILLFSTGIAFRHCSVLVLLPPHRLSRPRCQEPPKSLHSPFRYKTIGSPLKVPWKRVDEKKTAHQFSALRVKATRHMVLAAREAANEQTTETRVNTGLWRLAYSSLNSRDSPIPMYSTYESCRTMPLFGGFSQESAVLPALAFRRRSIPIAISLIRLSRPSC
ncbi:hypothetical protein PR048_023121 [Dryococelus australis]|uniref:Uncharacterized protein n=1 Tax=Dryococelus australis TaxID=614101 RepID=A0ABQ9GT93_9NEOP|nr:hypothetical protein PR048_023121 [Dryococelus australis]